ncbi:response regulator transcription factor [Nonomuraea corallina]|uniref:response regulator transcription factor n=1 Tax=Nonomuraea corallina TaxID=2989783 RepID=UPI0038CD3043
MPPIRLIIVDDHPIVRDGLRGIFAGDPGFEVVGEAADGHEALAVACAPAPTSCSWTCACRGRAAWRSSAGSASRRPASTCWS